MANTFKNAFAANVNHAAYVDLYTAGSGVTTVVLGLALCNKTAMLSMQQSKCKTPLLQVLTSKFWIL